MNLDFENIDQLFEDSLEGLELTPSAQVKTQVQKKMFWHNASKNIFVRANITLLLILILVGSFLLFNDPKDNQNKDVSAINIEQIQVNASNHKNLNINKTPIKNTNRQIGNNSESLATQTHNLSSLSNSKLISSNIAKNNSKERTSNHSNLNTKSQEKLKAQNQTTNKSELSKVSEEKKSTPKQVLPSTNYQEKEDLDKTNINFLLAKSDASLSQIPYPNLNNYPLIDDTVGINIRGEKIILPSNLWTVGAYVRPNYSTTRFNNTNTSENQDISNINSNAHNPAYSYGFGLELSYQFKQVSLGGGLAYSKYAQNFNALEKSLETQEFDFWDYTYVENWDITNTSYLNLDSLLQGDTVITVITDSTKYITQDSTLNSRIDSAWLEKPFANKNIYQYFEIPLFVEYSFNRSKTWQPFIRVGLITGIYIKSKSYYTNTHGEIKDASTMPFTKFNFWGHTGLGIKYNLSNKISTYFSLNYRYNLNAIVKDKQYFNQHLDNVGITISLQYHF